MGPEYKFKGKYNPKSNRLQNYDYGSNGGYFITICTKDRQNYFGEIIDGKMILNDMGKIVYDEIIKTPEMRKNVLLDEFIIMPNHLHLILIINNYYENFPVHVETHCNVSLQKNETLQQNKFGPQKNNLGSIIRGLKGGIKNQINSKYLNENYFSWQPNYYDRIIRNEDELNRVRNYILENTLKWEENKDNIENIFM